MKSNSIFSYIKKTSKSSSLVNYTRQDLNQKWLNRIQTKATDSLGQEGYSKLSSLVDFYSKKTENQTVNIDWDFWKSNIRTQNLVDNIMKKTDSLSEKKYNVDTIALKSAANSEKFENYGLFLKYNYTLWNNHLVRSLNAVYSLVSISDISLISQKEFNSFFPGLLSKPAAWRETGYASISKFYFYFIDSVYYENSASMAISNQYRFTNSSWTPYAHSICAWERGLVGKHVLMSL